MAVQLRLKSDRARTYSFPDDETYRFTAREYWDGRLEVIQTRRGSSDPGVVVKEFAMHEIVIIDNGWPTDE